MGVRARNLVQALAATALLIGACTGDDPSLTPGAEDDAGADGPGGGGCPASQKECGGACVPNDNPRFGCAETTCTACLVGSNTAATCAAGKCGSTCNMGFGDCDKDPANGCEVPTSNDVANCGSCGNVCGNANTAAASLCQKGACIFTCKPGYARCGADSDGCNTLITGTDAANCGACKRDCGGGTCTAGECSVVTLASQIGGVVGLAVDGTNVYVTASNKQNIYKIPKTQTPSCSDFGTTICAFLNTGTPGNVANPEAIATDGTNVYWANFDAAMPTPLLRVAIVAGGAPVSVGDSHGVLPGAMAIAGGKLWWSNRMGTVHVASNSLLGAAPATPVVTGTATSRFGLTADADGIYWISGSTPTIFKRALGSAACDEDTANSCDVLVPSNLLVAPFAIATDKDYVYWSDAVGGKIVRMSKAGGGIPVVLATGQDATRSIVADGTYVYWSNWSSGSPSTTINSVRRVRIDVATPCVEDSCPLIAGVLRPVLAQDATTLYWLAFDSGVQKRTK